MRPLMIMVAPNGARTLKKDNPSVPITPAEIATDVVRCAEAGASIAHIHARHPDGQPTQDNRVFAEIVERIREKSDIVLQLSLGTLGFDVEEILQPLELDPEMVSFPMRDFAQSRGLVVPDAVAHMADAIAATRAVPELDIADESMLAGVNRLLDSALCAAAVTVGINIKEPVSMHQGAQRLLDMTGQVPAGRSWWITKGGDYQLGLRALAIELGGHVRVGMEDSIYDLSGGGIATSNAQVVERVSRLCHSLGRPCASPADVRAFLQGERDAASNRSAAQNPA